MSKIETKECNFNKLTDALVIAFRLAITTKYKQLVTVKKKCFSVEELPEDFKLTPDMLFTNTWIVGTDGKVTAI